MKKLQFILLTCAICVGQLLYAQEPNYSWGEPATNDFIERKIDRLISLGDDGFVLLRKYTDNTFTSHYWLESYNSELGLVDNQEIDFNVGVMGDSYDLQGIDVVKGRILAAVTHWDKQAQSHSLSIHELKANGTLNFVADLGDITAQKMGNRGRFILNYSDDGSKLLVFSELPFVKKTKEKAQLACYSTDGFDLLWEQDVEFGSDSERAVNNEVKVSNAGQAYVFKRMWVKPEWKYAFYSCNKDLTWESFDNIDLSGKEIVDYQWTVNEKDAVFFYASYSTNSSSFNKNVHGTCFIRFENDMNASVRISAWDEDVLTYFIGDRFLKNPEKGMLQDFGLKDILHRKDGNLLVLFEKSKKDKDPVAGSSPIQYTYKWNYQDVLVLCIDPYSGMTNWWQTFNKNQELVSNEDRDEFGSFVYHLKDERLVILWNNTALSIPSIPPAFWKEPDGTKYVKSKAFHDKTMHATFMHVIEPDGTMAYANRTHGLPLLNLHQGAVFEMSLTTPFFFEVNGDLVLMSMMHNGGKRYRFGFLGL